MALIVKIMAGLSLPDDSMDHPHSLYTGVRHVEFHVGKTAMWKDLREDIRRTDFRPYVELTFTEAAPDEEPMQVAVQGAVYVMNEQGKTISSFSPKLRASGWLNGKLIPLEIGQIHCAELHQWMRFMSTGRPEGNPGERLRLYYLADSFPHEIPPDGPEDQFVEVRTGAQFWAVPEYAQCVDAPPSQGATA